MGKVANDPRRKHGDLSGQIPSSHADATERGVAVSELLELPAFADAQVTIEKQVTGERTATQARPVEGDERIVELSRMLSGQPDSATARQHADELLGEAAARHAIR